MAAPALAEYELAPNVAHTLRAEAVRLVREQALPHWMHFDDLMSAGWLGYQQATRRATSVRAHNFIQQWVRGAMLSEIRLWYGAGKRQAGIQLVTWDIRHHDVAQPDVLDVDVADAHEHQADALINEVIRHLPLHQRQALWIWCTQANRYVDVASILGISAAQARNYILQGIRTIKQQLAGKLMHPCHVETCELTLTLVRLRELALSGDTI